MHSTWPDALWLIRHGESAANQAGDEAAAQDSPVIEVAERDMDVPLSALGRRQSAAVGHWLRGVDPREQPTVVYVSPYRRATETAEIALEAAGLTGLHRVVDERLREREFGVLDGLTARGIRERFPVEAERRERLGKFYHRAPGGESWADVVQRVRAVVDELRRDHAGERVVVVAHQVVVLLFRYVLERLEERAILTIDRAEEVANCSITRFEFDAAARRLVLQVWNADCPLVADGEQVTREPDVAAGPR